jgi:hypothetical protein
MKGLLSYNNDFAKAEGLGLCWTKDTSPDTVLANNLGFAARQSLIVAKPDPRGSFAFCVPLDHLFGFCQNYRKVIYGVNHRIALTRQSDTDAIYREDTVKAGKITLTNISWHMPKVVPSLMVKNDFGKLIQSKSRLSVAYRSLQCESRAMPAAKTDTWDLVSKSGTELPRWLLVAFQTGKAENQTRNPAVVDNVRLTKIHATVNGRRYTDADVTSDFASYSFAQLYNAMKQFKPEYYGVPGMESTNSITHVEFCELYPIHVIDLRRQPEKLKDVSLDIKIKTTFSANVPAGTLGYALLISDRKFFLESDGSNFRMVTNLAAPLPGQRASRPAAELHIHLEIINAHSIRCVIKMAATKSRYVPFGLSLTQGQKETLAKAARGDYGETLRLGVDQLQGDDMLGLTKTQIAHITKNKSARVGPKSSSPRPN